MAKKVFTQALVASALVSTSMAWAQNAPVPGTGTNLASGGYPAVQPSAPPPGTPLPSGGVHRGVLVSTGKSFGYGDLPLNADDAKAKVVELSGMASTARPQDLQENVEQLCAWLSDMIDAHNKMANAFSKHEQLKLQCTAERQSAQKFARLKNQAQLLKADLLIAMRRYPEALVPLVEIVINEPTTETGKGAYKRLQDLGFSPEAAEMAEPVAGATSSGKTGNVGTANAEGAVASTKQRYVIVPAATRHQAAYSTHR